MRGAVPLKGLTAAGSWDLPARLNMAEQALSGASDAIAIVDMTGPERRNLTFGDLSQMVDGLARYLHSRISAGDRVGVLLSQSPWCAAAHLAIWKLGAISVPLFKLFRQDALASRAGDAGVQFVFTDPEGAVLLGDLAEAVMVDQAGVRGMRLPLRRPRRKHRRS